MRSEGLSFPESVERLARSAGLPRSPPVERQRAERQSTLVTAMETAAWYQEQLGASRPDGAPPIISGAGARRGKHRAFRLGYAPDGRAALRDALTRAGFHRAGAGGGAGRQGRGRPLRPHARRVIFPIADRRGRVIAFGGRIRARGSPNI
jgi:DNA primase